MSDMPDRITIARADNGRGETLETLFIVVNEPDGATYIRADLVPSWNRDMSAAPKGGPILAWCDHEADPYEIGRTSDGRRKLTLYAAHVEGLGHTGTGFRVIEWGGGWNDCPEDGGGGLPDWWFVADSDFEVPANPIAWMPLPKHPDDEATHG